MADFYHDDYLRRLLIESPYIRAKLTNPGGSIIMASVAADTDRVNQDYSSQIGSGFHLDLIEAEVIFRELPEDQQQALLAWAAGVSSKEAAMYSNVKGNVHRKRVERGLTALTDKMNDGTEGNEPRGTSGRDSTNLGPPTAQIHETTRDRGRKKTPNYSL
jgi:hypothetical protein